VIVYLFKGTALVSKLIRWQSRSEYSHAAIGDGTHVWEAVGSGVRKLHVEDLPTHYSRVHCDKFTVPMTPVQEEGVVHFLNKQIGKPYDMTMVIRFLTRNQAHRESRGKWFCSELVAAALGKAQPVLHRIEPWAVSPGMLSYSPLLAKVPKQMISPLQEGQQPA
jgi:hypothetical protein